MRIFQGDVFAYVFFVGLYVVFFYWNLCSHHAIIYTCLYVQFECTLMRHTISEMSFIVKWYIHISMRN